MKILTLITAGLMSGAASAHSVVQCTTPGSLGNVTVTIRSESSLLAPQTYIQVVAKGRRTTTYNALATNAGLNEAGALTLNVQSLLLGSTDVDPNGIIGTITLATSVVVNFPLVLQPVGDGSIDLTQTGFGATASKYPLSDCKGIL